MTVGAYVSSEEGGDTFEAEVYFPLILLPRFTESLLDFMVWVIREGLRGSMKGIREGAGLLLIEDGLVGSSAGAISGVGHGSYGV